MGRGGRVACRRLRGNEAALGEGIVAAPLGTDFCRGLTQNDRAFLLRGKNRSGALCSISDGDQAWAQAEPVIAPGDNSSVPPMTCTEMTAALSADDDGGQTRGQERSRRLPKQGSMAKLHPAALDEQGSHGLGACV